MTNAGAGLRCTLDHDRLEWMLEEVLDKLSDRDVDRIIASMAGTTARRTAVATPSPAKKRMRCNTPSPSLKRSASCSAAGLDKEEEEAHAPKKRLASHSHTVIEAEQRIADVVADIEAAEVGQANRSDIKRLKQARQRLEAELADKTASRTTSRRRGGGRRGSSPSAPLFACSVCPKRFAERRHVITHERIHTGAVKPTLKSVTDQQLPAKNKAGEYTVEAITSHTVEDGTCW